MKAVATGSASCEPSTTGLGPRDSPGGNAHPVSTLRAPRPPHPGFFHPPPNPDAPRGGGHTEKKPRSPRLAGAECEGQLQEGGGLSERDCRHRKGGQWKEGGRAAAPPSPSTPFKTHQVTVAACSWAGCRALRPGAARGGHQWDLAGGGGGGAGGCGHRGGQGVMRQRGQ